MVTAYTAYVRAKVKVPKDECRRFGGWLYNATSLFLVWTNHIFDIVCLGTQPQPVIDMFAKLPGTCNEEESAEQPPHNVGRIVCFLCSDFVELVGAVCHVQTDAFRTNPVFGLCMLPLACAQGMASLAILSVMKVLKSYLSLFRGTAFTAFLPFEFTYQTSADEPREIVQERTFDCLDNEDVVTFEGLTGGFRNKVGDVFEIHVPPFLNKCLFKK